MKSDHYIVSVVIPTIGRTTINLCKDALDKQTRTPDEIITILDNVRRGPSWARNEGIRQACGDLIAFIDDDCVPPKNWLERLIEAIENHDAAGAGGTYEETDALLRDICLRQSLRRMFPQKEQVDTLGLVGSSGNVMYKRSWLDACAEHDGYIFNELFRNSEDWELAWRLRRRGAKLIFVPTKVTHLRKVTPFAYFRLQFNRGIGIAGLYRAQSSVNSKTTVHKSLIWGQINTKKGAKWFQAFWYKVIGPFDMRSFKQMRNFWLFWIGEKIQGIGFVWGIFFDAIRGKIVQKRIQEINRI